MNNEIIRPRDRAFNPWRIPSGKPSHQLLSSVLRILSDHEKVKPRLRKRRAQDQQRYERLVSAVIMDVTYNHVSDEPGQIRISRSGRVLNWRSRYTPDFYTQKTLPGVLDSMKETQLIRETKGQPGRRPEFAKYTHQTTIAASERLAVMVEQCGVTVQDISSDYEGQEIVILKGDKKSDEEGDDDEDDEGPGNLIDYQDTNQTNDYRDEVKKINAHIAEAEITLFGYSGLPSEVVRRVDLRARYLRRYFTMGSFESGGRLFGGFWQQMSKEHRKAALLIQGRFITELDYGSMLPRLLYGKAWATLPANLDHDPYAVPGFLRSRKAIKKLFGAMLFGENLSKWTKYPDGIEELFHADERKPVQEVMRAIMEAHHHVRHLFGTRIGHKLQYIESEILVDVLLELIRKDVVALPIHDAVLVAQDEAERTKGVMLAVFRRYAGIEGRVSAG